MNFSNSLQRRDNFSMYTFSYFSLDVYDTSKSSPSRGGRTFRCICFRNSSKDDSHEGDICTMYARTEATCIKNLIRCLSGKSWRLDFEPMLSGRSVDWMFGRRNTRIWKRDHWIMLEHICTRWQRICFVQQSSIASTTDFYIDIVLVKCNTFVFGS